MNHYKIDYKKYLNVDTIFKYYKKYKIDKLMLIADNGCGKTYSAIVFICKHFLIQDKTACWIRNTELESEKAIEGFNEVLIDLGMDKYYKVDRHGVWKIEHWGGTGKPDKFKLAVAFVYLSSLATSIPTNLKAKCVVLDEFIDGNTKRKFTMNNYDDSLKKAVNRLTRPIKSTVYTIMLSNPHELQHDLIYTFGDFDWDKLNAGEVDYIYNEKRNFVGICIPKQFNIKEMEKTYFYWNKQQKENYRFLSNKYKVVYTDWKDSCEFFMKITTQCCVFAIGNIIVNDQPSIYIYELINISDYDDLENVAVKPVDKEQFNTYYIDPEIRASKLMPVFNAIFANKAYFSTDNGYECFKKIANEITLIAKQKLNTII